MRDYQIRRLERERQRRDHLRNAGRLYLGHHTFPDGRLCTVDNQHTHSCRCVDCVGVDGVAAVFQQIKAAEIRRTGPAPF
jgi:hypothetical protein